MTLAQHWERRGDVLQAQSEERIVRQHQLEVVDRVFGWLGFFWGGGGAVGEYVRQRPGCGCGVLPPG